jgi:hypothetical protein
MSGRLVTKLWGSGLGTRERAIVSGRESDGGRERRGIQRERANRNHWASPWKVAPYSVQSTSDKSSRLVDKKQEETKEKEQWQ